MALDARQAGAARGRGGRHRRRLQCAGLVVLPAVLHLRQRDRVFLALPALTRAVRPARGRVRRLDVGCFAIGVLAGMLIRRVVPAIVATLAAYAGLALLAANVLRQHYLAPLVAKGSNLPGAAWITSEWWTKGGKFVFGARPPIGLLQQLCPATFVTGPGGKIGIKGGAGAPTTCLVQHGYAQWADYQPAGHFWPFQWIEGGWLLALSVLLIGVTVWLVRRRVT